jgi:hypothetical protein
VKATASLCIHTNSKIGRFCPKELIFDSSSPDQINHPMESTEKSIRSTILSMRILSAAIIIFLALNSLHIFDIVEKGFLFYFLLAVDLAYLISAVGMWKPLRWPVYLFFVITLVLFIAFGYFHSWDYRTILMAVVVFIVSALNWKSLK